MSEWEGASFTFHQEPEPPPMKPGDQVTWMDDDGVMDLVVVEAEPWEDEDGGKGQSIRFRARRHAVAQQLTDRPANAKMCLPEFIGSGEAPQP